MSATAPVEPSAASPGGAAGTGEGLGAYARRWWTGVRSGDLGSLPIVVGLVLIAVIFQSPAFGGIGWRLATLPTSAFSMMCWPLPLRMTCTSRCVGGFASHRPMRSRSFVGLPFGE